MKPHISFFNQVDVPSTWPATSRRGKNETGGLTKNASICSGKLGDAYLRYTIYIYLASGRRLTVWRGSVCELWNRLGKTAVLHVISTILTTQPLLLLHNVAVITFLNTACSTARCIAYEGFSGKEESCVCCRSMSYVTCFTIHVIPACHVTYCVCTSDRSHDLPNVYIIQVTCYTCRYVVPMT